MFYWRSLWLLFSDFYVKSILLNMSYHSFKCLEKFYCSFWTHVHTFETKHSKKIIQNLLLQKVHSSFFRGINYHIFQNLQKILFYCIHKNSLNCLVLVFPPAYLSILLQFVMCIIMSLWIYELSFIVLGIWFIDCIFCWND